MKIPSLNVIAANEKAPEPDRTRGAATKMIAVVALALGLAGALAATGAIAAEKTEAKSHPMTPEIKLVDDYNTWFMGQAFDGDMVKLKAGLPKYITNDTVLHEAVSLPWGGTMVGYDGWVRLLQISAPIFGKITSVLDVSTPKYYQHGNVVIHEITMTIKSTKAAPEPFVMGMIEKYTIEKGRISQIDEFYADTASLLQRLRVVGALPDHK